MNRHADALLALAHPQGGWAYSPGQTAQIEPTCFALLALTQTLKPAELGTDIGRGAVDAVEKGIAFLERQRGSDGAYRLADAREEAIWTTPLVLFTLAALGRTGPRIDETAAFLLAIKGRVPDNPLADELHDIDLKVLGWPWAENNFSWVEPTAWACLALRKVGQGQQPRVQEGMQMILDRAMDGGGVNYGNRRILGKMTDPIPGPTALMLLALQGRDHPRLAAAVAYLLHEIERGDAEHRAWIRLALDAYPDAPGVAAALSGLEEKIEQALQQREETRFLRPAPVRLALAMLAESCGESNPFRLDLAPTAGPAILSPSSYQPRRPGLGRRMGTWFRGLAVKAAGALKPPPAFSAVHIARAPSYDDDLVSILHKQYEHFRPHVALADKKVVLKPNLVEWHRDKVINTNPRVVDAVIELCKKEGAKEIIVAEGPGHWRNVEYLVEASGLGDVLRRHDLTFVDLNHDEPVKTPNLGRLTGLEYLYLTRTIVTADVVISLPKLKTHHWAGATLSLKNLFGTLPGICYGWPKNELHWRGIDNSIVDIALTRTPELAIVDAVVGMEGDGPLNGVARPFGALVMGHDLVALDATCCRLMMLDPEKIGYLALGQMKKLGRLRETEIPQLGEAIGALAQPFDTVDHLKALRLGRPA